MADDNTASVKRVLSDDNASLEDKLKAMEQMDSKRRQRLTQKQKPQGKLPRPLIRLI